MYFKELAHTIMSAGKPEIHRAGQQLGYPARGSTLQSGGRIPSYSGTSFFSPMAFN